MDTFLIRRLTWIMGAIYLTGFAWIHITLNADDYNDHVVVPDGDTHRESRMGEHSAINKTPRRTHKLEKSKWIAKNGKRIVISDPKKKLAKIHKNKVKKVIYKHVNITLAEYVSDTRNTCRAEEEAWLKRNVSTNQKLCPCFGKTTPPSARLHINMSSLLELTWPEVSRRLHSYDLDPGGRWRPAECAPRRRVAVIVPFRDRERHLRAFLVHTHPVLQSQQVDYTIYVVEQNAPWVFNKGSIMNAGFQEVMRLSSHNVPDCFVFHDVDLLVETTDNLFICRKNVTHLAAFVDKFNYTLLYYKMFGGAVALTADQFSAINGYSNHYGGWGGEDDEFFGRMFRRGRAFYRPPPEISRYQMIKHSRDTGNPVNKQAFRAFKMSTRVRSDGLSTLKYTCRSVDYLDSHTRIVIDLPEKTRMIQDFKVVQYARCRDEDFYKQPSVSLVTCKNLCLRDDVCRTFQHVKSPVGDNKCQMMKFVCERFVQDNFTDLYIWVERVNLMQPLLV